MLPSLLRLPPLLIGRTIGDSLWVPKTSVPSCGLLISFDQASDGGCVAPALAVVRGYFEPVGWSLAEGAVWPMSVVVRDVSIQDRSQVAAAEDKDPVGAFAPDRANPAFGESVRAGRAYRRTDDHDLFRGEHGIETSYELGVAIPNQERSWSTRSPRSMSRLRACWVTHDLVGWAVMPARCTLRVPSSRKNRT